MRRQRTTARFVRSAALLLLFGIHVTGCGDGGGDNANGSDTPPLPARTDAQFGTAGNLLGSDRGRSVDETVDQLWIGFNREEAWTDYVELRDRLAAQGTRPYVGGMVVADPEKALGFYFDPNTTSAGELVAETFQTSLDQLKLDPAGAAAARHRWAVVFVEERALDSDE